MKLGIFVFMFVLGLILSWEQAFGKTIVVAVIDTGLDPTDSRFQNQIWTNQGETGLDSKGRDKRTNGIDDDGNGFVDDVHGWNFAGQSSDLKDSHGHGTHVSGLITERVSNLTSAIQKTAAIQLMTLKYYDAKVSNLNNLQYLVRALQYAVRMKADIINYSGGGAIPSRAEKAVIAAAQQQGILVVAAAGNESANSDRHPFYPAGYRLSNILSVGAHDRHGDLISASNYGSRTVDLAALGLSVLSTLPDEKKGRLSGTSQATAFATQAAAELLSQRPDLSPEEVIGQLRASVEFDAQLSGKVMSLGRLDLRRALTLRDRNRSFSGYRLSPQTISQLDSARFSH